MLIKIYLIIYFLSLHSYAVLGYNCLPNDEDFTKGCDILVTRGYNYTHFFPVEKLPNGNIFLRFYVKAEADGHILFSNNNPQGISESLGRHYEILIGAYDNFQSTIRTRIRGDITEPYNEKNILSSTKWREFWIRISTDGLIQVGKDSSKDAFMSWTDPNTFEINYYSFSCWGPDNAVTFESRHIASYIHQCSTTNYTKYNVEKFKCNLLSKYDQRIPSTETANGIIKINISNSYTNWDPANEIFQLIGNAKVIWKDSRLAWEPIEHYRLQSLDLTNDSIWRPEITLRNAVLGNDKPIASGRTTVSHDGLVSWTAPINLHTKCSSSETPGVQKCPINLTINTAASRIYLSDVTHQGNKVTSKWAVTKIEAVGVKDIEEKSSIHSISIEVPYLIPQR